MGEAVSIMLDAARAFAPLDIRLARDAVLDAIQMSVYFGDASAVPTVDVAQVARSFTLPEGTAPTTTDLVLDAIAETFAAGYTAAVPLLRDALFAALTDSETRRMLRPMSKACWVAFALSDDDALLTLASTCASTSREQGAFQVLPEALDYLALREVRVGTLNAADDYCTEIIEMHTVLRRESGTDKAAQLIVSAWRGREAEVRTEAASLAARATDLGLVRSYTDYAVAILELGLGNYQAASVRADEDWTPDLGFSGLRAADAVEAHVRSGNHGAARAALDHLTERATANQSALDLGLLARSRALLAGDDDAEDQFRESIVRLDASGGRHHVARTQLVYGEWLRRQKRRRDARIQLEAARDIFDSMGANGFAERARIELLATGAQARKRVDETRTDLTPQESQIARLAASGLTNPEIAARLFISANTVDYHLRKVYRKLDIKTRHELGSVLPVT